MTEIVPTASAVPAQAAPVDPAEAEAFETMRRDAVLAGRAMSSGQYIAGLLAAAELETVGTPSKLPADLEPDVDPVVVQRIWDRALAVGVHVGRAYWAPRLHPDELEATRAALAEAGFHAMAGLVARSGRLVARARQAHPGDGEIAREHGH